MCANITDIILEISVENEDESEGAVQGLYLHPTGEKLDFGFEGKWLVDFKAFHCDAELPSENGWYRMRAEWDDCCEIVESVWDIEKIHG